eukprot:s87_g30.t1
MCRLPGMAPETVKNGWTCGKAFARHVTHQLQLETVDVKSETCCSHRDPLLFLHAFLCVPPACLGLTKHQFHVTLRVRS